MRFHLDVVQKIALAPFLIGGLSIYVGEEGSLPAFTGLGAILIAAAPAVMGLHAVVTGRIALRIDRYGAYEEVYRSIGARAWGLLFILSSIALAIYGVFKLGGFEAEGEEAFVRWPGLAAAVVGVGLLLYGVAQANSAEVLHHGRVRQICLLPERIGGALTALIGAALVAGGLLHMASPAAFDSLTERLGSMFLRTLERLAT
jgi:hypothetical protein